jgi:energy-coupling factor transport system ATP-binding protein
MTFDLQDVTFSYQTKNRSGRSVIDGVNLSIQQGECVGVIGHEGAGKTTLLQLMMGLVKPVDGTINVDGVDIWRKQELVSELRRQIGFAFQFPEQQFFCETVEDEFRYAPENFGNLAGFMKPGEALSAFGMRPELYMNRSPFSLSMGEARLIALSMLLMTRPQTLLLDEPTVGLDGAGVDIVLNLLRRMKTEAKTIVMVSHDIDVLAEIASRVIIMKNGRIEEDGPVAEILTNGGLLSTHGYQLPEVVRFMREEGHGGSETVNAIYTFRETKLWFDSVQNLSG